MTGNSDFVAQHVARSLARKVGLRRLHGVGRSDALPQGDLRLTRPEAAIACLKVDEWQIRLRVLNDAEYRGLDSDLSVAAKKGTSLAGEKAPLVWLRNGLRRSTRGVGFLCGCPAATARSVARSAGSVSHNLRSVGVSQGKSSFLFPSGGARLKTSQFASSGEDREPMWDGPLAPMAPWPPRICSAKTPHRIGRPICLENPRPKGGMLIHGTTPPSPLTATEHSRCGSHWPTEMVPSPAAANTLISISTFFRTF